MTHPMVIWGATKLYIGSLFRRYLSSAGPYPVDRTQGGCTPQYIKSGRKRSRESIEQVNSTRRALEKKSYAIIIPEKKKKKFEFHQKAGERA